MKKHLPLLIIGILVVCLSLVACTQQPAKPVGKTITIAVFIPNGGDGYYQNKSYGYIQGGLMLEATNPGVKVNVELYNAGGYDQAEKQISQVEDAITRKVNAIILTACNKEALAPVVNKAMAAGIPVINDDVLVNAKTTTSISENSYNVGRNAAEYIARILNGKGKAVMLKGAPGGQLFMDRAQGAHDEFARFPDMKVVAEQYHQVNIVDGRKVMEDFIQAQGKNINAVWSTNATVAIGAAQALEAAGYKPGQIPIIGIDFHDEALKYMANGWITGLIPCQPVKLARMAVQYAFAAANGQKVPEKIYTTDDTVVDAKMLPSFDQSDAMAPAGWKPPLR